MAAVPARPLLVTGTHRSGKGFVTDALLCTRAFHRIHEPLSPLRRPGRVRQPATRWFQYLPTPESASLRSDLPGMLTGQFHWGAALRSLRNAHDVDRMLRDITKTLIGRRRLQCRPMIDDPFALMSVDWFRDELDAEIVVLIRHPASFAASLKLFNYSIPFEDLLAQPELMAGPLGSRATELKAVACRGGDLVEQAAFFWLAVYEWIDTCRSRANDAWHFVRFEDIARNPVAEMERLASALATPYSKEGCTQLIRYVRTGRPKGFRGEVARLDPGASLDISTQVDYFARILEPAEISRVRDITAPIWPRFYADSEWYPHMVQPNFL